MEPIRGETAPQLGRVKTWKAFPFLLLHLPLFFPFFFLFLILQLICLSSNMDFSFPRQPPPLQILVLDDEIARELNRRPREPLTAIAGPWTRQASPYQEQSKLTQDEQKVALQKLKKEIYNPMPKIISRRLSLFYQDNDRYHVSEKRKEHEDLKRCAICLEDFEPREQVLLTPCNHMFHEDCIVPWVKNHGQCPVCRFAICDRMKQSTAPSNNNMPVIYF